MREVAHITFPDISVER